MKKRFVLAGLLILGTASPAVAQSPGDLLEIGECAARRVPAADRSGVAEALRAGRAPDQDLMGRVMSYVRRCTPRSEETNPVALTSAVAQIARVETGALLGRSGINTGVVDRWFSRQSNARKTNLAVTTEQGEAFARELIAAGLPEAPVTANATLIGGYIGTLIVIERIRQGMPPTQ